MSTTAQNEIDATKQLLAEQLFADGIAEKVAAELVESGRYWLDDSGRTTHMGVTFANGSTTLDDPADIEHARSLLIALHQSRALSKRRKRGLSIAR